MAHGKCFVMCAGLTVLAASLWIAGCASQEADEQSASPAANGDDAMMHDHDAHDAADTAPESDAASDAETDAEIQASLASLSAEDRALALKQKTCPVSGDPLGVMGTPIKLNVKGHDVFICCPGCKEPLEENPDEYLAKLGLEPAVE